MRPTSENDLAADDAWIRGELSAPERVADNGDRPPDIVGIERATKRGCDAKERQKSRRHVARAHPLSRTELCQRQVCPIERFERRQRSSTLAPRLEGCIAHRSWSGRGLIDRRLTDGDEGIGIREGWRREQHGIDDGEDRSAGAERQRQRQDRGHRAGR